MFFGDGNNDVAKKYVDDVFDEFDYDASGELSYEEAKDFVKSIYKFMDEDGNISEDQRANFIALLEAEDELYALEAKVR